MSYTTFAFLGSITGATANSSIALVADNLIRSGTSGGVLPLDLNIYAVSAGSANLTAARLSAPSLNALGGPSHIRPIDQSLTPSADPQVCDLSDRPLKVRMNEELIAQVGGTSGYNESAYCVIHAGTSIDPLPSGGNPIMLRGTASTTTSNGSYTQLGTITWENSLPQGVYAVTFFLVQSTNGLVARLNFANQVFRPGSTCTNAAGDNVAAVFAQRRLGTLGTFPNWNFPSIELLSIGSNDTSQTIFMECVKVQ